MCLSATLPGQGGCYVLRGSVRSNTVACFIDDVRLPARADGYYNNMSAAGTRLTAVRSVRPADVVAAGVSTTDVALLLLIWLLLESNACVRRRVF